MLSFHRARNSSCYKITSPTFSLRNISRDLLDKCVGWRSPSTVLCRCKAAQYMSESSVPDETWKLYYWPGIKGRGEYVRLIFEEAGVPYTDVGKVAGFAGVRDFCWGGGNQHFPARAPPVVQHGSFVLCNTPAIQTYLGRVFGLMPQSAEDQAHVESLVAVVTDAVAEGRLAFHPKDFYASHKLQVEESKPYIKQYGEERLPKYVTYFEDVLKKNPSGPDFLVGDKISVADLAVYQFLAAAEQHYATYYSSIQAPLCKALLARVAARPRIAAYLQSDRCPPWDTDSMM